MQFFHQQAVVVFVCGIFARKAGGIDTRRSAQCIHAQPRIVSHRRTSGFFSGMPSLGQTVFNKGVKGLRARLYAEGLLAFYVHIEVREHRLKFADLAGIAGGKHKNRIVFRHDFFTALLLPFPSGPCAEKRPVRHSLFWPAQEVWRGHLQRTDLPRQCLEFRHTFRHLS